MLDMYNQAVIHADNDHIVTVLPLSTHKLPSDICPHAST